MRAYCDFEEADFARERREGGHASFDPAKTHNKKAVPDGTAFLVHYIQA